jgi:competence protein ComEC
LAIAIEKLAFLPVFERDRWPLWLPVMVGLGAGLYFALPVEPAEITGWSFLGAGIAMLVLLPFLERGKVLLALAAALALGFGAAKLRATQVAAPVLARPAIVHMTARIVAMELGNAGTRLTLGDPISGGFPDNAIPKRLRVTMRGDASGLTPGQWVSLTAGLSPPLPPSQPRAADFARAAWFNAIGASGFSFGAPLPAMTPRPPTFSQSLADSVAALRWRMTQRIRAVLPGSQGAIAAALVTGIRGGIAEADDEALRDSGLAHVISISGLHMVLVGMGLFWLVRALLAFSPFLALHYPIKKWAALAALAGAGFYLVLSGAAAPAARAYLMLAVGLIAVLLDRPAFSMRGLAVAACLLLLLQPEAITDPGFQMSFAAVAALVAAAEAGSVQRGPVGRGANLLSASAVASLATLPFVLFHFGRAAHYGVLGNLVATPVIGLVVMPFAALSLLAMPLGLEAWPLQALGWGIAVMLRLGHWVAQLPGAATLSPAMPMTALLLMVLGGLWLLVWRGKQRWAGLAGIGAGILVAFLARGPDMLVAPDAATVALRAADGKLYFVGRAQSRFIARDWLRRDGDPREPADALGLGRCDGLGCAVPAQIGQVVVSRRAEALAEDCSRAVLLVSVANTDCKGPRLILDGARAVRDQGYALTFTPELRVESVREWRGARPWVR